MIKHRRPGGVKVARFPGMSEVSGSIPVSGLCFPLNFVVFTRALLIVTLIGRAPPALHFRSYNIVHLCVLIVG